MRPESLKCLLNCYLREKFNSSQYDEVDGIYSSDFSPQCAGEPSEALEDTLSEFSYLHLQQAEAVLPQLYDAVVPPEVEERAKELGRQLSQMSDEFEENRSRSNSTENWSNDIGNSCVQFQQRCIFVTPSSSKVEISIVRIGNADGLGKVKWETVDKTAKAGVHYISSSGDISFAEGETEKTIEIEIIRNQADRNIAFTVNLLNSEGIEIGSDATLTVYIADHSNFVQVERQVVDNIINCPQNASVSEIALCLHDDLTVNTFRTALQYRCSYFDSLPEQLAFAFELVRLSVGRAPLETLGDIVSKFFSYLPELEDLTEVFK